MGLSIEKNGSTNLICDKLAQFIVSTTFERLPDNVVKAVKRTLLDTLGVAIGALAEEGSDVVLDYVKNVSGKSEGSAAVLGQGYRTLPEYAALANGTLAHLLDFDDSHNPMGGHPSAPLLAAVLAMADHLNASGKDVILAFAIGFEVETKLSRVMNPLLYGRGWHPTSILTTFGTTAAVASLLKLDISKTVYALATATSFCSGIKGNFGTLTKPLHVGSAAQKGIQVAYLSLFGNTANRAIFESKMGFLDLFCSPDSDDWKIDQLKNLGEQWELVNPGNIIKPYPCCGSAHSTIDGHLTLRKEHPIKVEDIAWIRNAIHERRIPHINRPILNSALEGKFSNQYVTALVWGRGYVGLDHFIGEVYKEADILNLMSKITFEADPDISSTSYETHAFVEVGTKDGRVYSHKVTKRKGTSQNPLTDHELEEKFNYCVNRVHNQEWIVSVIEIIKQFERMVTVKNLTDKLLETPTTGCK